MKTKLRATGKIEDELQVVASEDVRSRLSSVYLRIYSNSFLSTFVPQEACTLRTGDFQIAEPSSPRGKVSLSITPLGMEDFAPLSSDVWPHGCSNIAL